MSSLWLWPGETARRQLHNTDLGVKGGGVPDTDTPNKRD